MNLNLELFKEAIAKIILLNYFGINIFDENEDLEGNGDSIIVKFKRKKDLFMTFPYFDGWPWREPWQ